MHMNLLFFMDCYIQQQCVYCTEDASSIDYNKLF